ncbi:TetR/AcrR family transcriptional regulator [Kitasatospora sp. NPDC048365]|uniref:TetR/AcrR family transcriptional regulator n=1 Tax=Kitasatospora sp. NPDC048365 TaxID=3364050 RepID=UPI00371BBAA3
MDQRPTLRERERQRRHLLIADTALQLFAERGFEDTTVQDIAAAVGMAPRTFFLHFPSKDDVLFDLDVRRCADLADRLAERPAGAGALEIAERVVHRWITERGPETEQLLARIIGGSPPLAARARLQASRYQDLLTVALRADLGAGPDDPRPAMAAAAALAGWEHAGRRHARGEATAAVLPGLLVRASAAASAVLATD